MLGNALIAEDLREEAHLVFANNHLVVHEDLKLAEAAGHEFRLDP